MCVMFVLAEQEKKNCGNKGIEINRNGICELDLTFGGHHIGPWHSFEYYGLLLIVTFFHFHMNCRLLSIFSPDTTAVSRPHLPY